MTAMKLAAIKLLLIFTAVSQCCRLKIQIMIYLRGQYSQRGVFENEQCSQASCHEGGTMDDWVSDAFLSLVDKFRSANELQFRSL